MCALDNEMGESGFCEEAFDIVDILKKSFSIAQAGG